jgi:hypothetical protein
MFAEPTSRKMLNSPREMLERLAYLIWLAITATSISAIFLAVFKGVHGAGLGLFAGGIGGTILSRLLHGDGRKHLHFDDCEDSLDFNGDGDPEHAARAENLRRLLARWNQLDARREQDEEDTWQVLAIRRETQSLLDADPGLRSEFDRQLARHPELRNR